MQVAAASTMPDIFGARLGAGLVCRSIHDGLIRAAARHPGKIAIVDLPDGNLDTQPITLTYADLTRTLIRYVNAMRHLGLREGDRILYLAPNTLNTLLGFWSAQSLGVVVPVNPFLDHATIADIAAASGARAVMTTGQSVPFSTFEQGAELVSSLAGLDIHLVLSGPAGAAIDLPAEAAAADGTFIPAWDGPSLQDHAAFFPTGGTTGAPKLAQLTHRNILVGALSSALASTSDADEVVPLGLPIFHVGGGIIVATRTLLLGQTLVILSPAGFRAPEILRNFWKLSDRYGFTQLITVPTTFADLLTTHEGTATSITRFIAGASKLPASLCQNYASRFGIGIHEGYGMTETSGFCCVNPTDSPPRPGSGGMIAPGYAVKIIEIDETGAFRRECAPGETGLIAVAGPGVFQGYLNPAQTRAKFIAGCGDEPWIDTGDLGRFENGTLWITGREKDLIIRGGHNIDPGPIEDILLAHPDVADAAVVGMPDLRVGELPVVFIQLAPHAVLDEAALRAYCAARLPERAGTPVRIFAADALPRTAMRKIFKPELRRLAAEAAILDALGARGISGWAVELDSRGCLSVRLPGGGWEREIIDLLGGFNIPVRVE